MGMVTCQNKAHYSRCIQHKTMKYILKHTKCKLAEFHSVTNFMFQNILNSSSNVRGGSFSKAPFFREKVKDLVLLIGLPTVYYHNGPPVSHSRC